MSFTRLILALALCAGSIPVLAGPVMAGDCELVEVIDVSDDAGDATSWYSITNSGDMAGNYCAQDTPCMGWDSIVGGVILDNAKGAFETFEAPKGYNIVQMIGMNESGLVVGTAVAGNGQGGIAGAAGFIYRDGVAELLDDPLGTGYFAATDVNNRGTIVGYASDGAGGRIGYALDRKGNLSLIEVDGAVRTFPFSINEHGDIAGYFLHKYGYSGGFVLAADGTMTIMTDVAEPPYHEYYLYGINNDGDLVGQYVKWSAGFDLIGRGAFVKPHDGEIKHLNVLDYGDTSFTSVNDAGVIAGTAGGSADGLRAYGCF